MQIAEISQQLSKKITAVSVLCTLLVVAVHVPRGADASYAYRLMLKVIPDGISEVAVPMFFAISGFFLLPKLRSGWYKEALVKRFRSLVIPYFALITIWVVYSFVYTGDLNLMRAYGLTGHPKIAPLWYVRNLILLVCLSPIFVGILSASRKRAIVYLMLLFISTVMVDGVKMPACLWAKFDYTLTFGFPLRSVFYFNLGIFARFHFVPYLESLGNKSILPGVVLLVFSEFLVNVACIRPCAVFLMVIGLWMALPPFAMPKWITTNLFPCYALHDIVFAHFKMVMGFFATQFFYSIPGYLLMYFACVVVVFSFAILSRKIAPRITNLIYGGR